MQCAKGNSFFSPLPQEEEKMGALAEGVQLFIHRSARAVVKMDLSGKDHFSSTPVCLTAKAAKFGRPCTGALA
jgi:hypothetical protein